MPNGYVNCLGVAVLSRREVPLHLIGNDGPARLTHPVQVAMSIVGDWLVPVTEIMA